jgi:hypothetical protein
MNEAPEDLATETSVTPTVAEAVPATSALQPNRVLSRLWRHLADAVFVVLLVASVILAGWLTARHDTYWDWTANANNSLTAESLAILETLKGPLRIGAYVGPEQPLAKTIERLVARYRRIRPDLELTFIDPTRSPEQARAADVTLLGQLVLEYQGRRETLRELGEATLTAAIARLTADRNTWVAALKGHGERDIAGTGDGDLGRFGQYVQGQGLRVQPLDLAIQKAVPANTDLLILSLPAVDLFPGEIDRLLTFLREGGNLLWLTDPGGLGGLDPIAAELGLRTLPGTLVDTNVRDLGIDTPTVAMVADYPVHRITAGLSAAALLPGAQALAPTVAAGWRPVLRLATRKGSWNETGPVRGEVTRDPAQGEEAGPLTVALALTRPSPKGQGEQRVAVVGDGDFLSNAHLSQGGNLDLGLRLVRWASGQPGPVPPSEPWAGDRDLVLDDLRRILLGALVLVILPWVFVLAGLLIRWHRWRD